MSYADYFNNFSTLKFTDKLLFSAALLYCLGYGVLNYISFY